MTAESSTPPVVDAVRYRPPGSTGTGVLRINCPYCPERHVHSTTSPEVGGSDGHRVAHCWSPAARARNGAGYILREVTP